MLNVGRITHEVALLKQVKKRKLKVTGDIECPTSERSLHSKTNQFDPILQCLFCAKEIEDDSKIAYE